MLQELVEPAGGHFFVVPLWWFPSINGLVCWGKSGKSEPETMVFTIKYRVFL
jgi:hypothetical protein